MFKGALPVRGGGLNACQDGLRHLSAPNQTGNLLDCGGVKMLARMVWGTYAVKIDVHMGICFLLRRVLRLARMLWGTYSPSKQ